MSTCTTGFLAAAMRVAAFVVTLPRGLQQKAGTAAAAMEAAAAARQCSQNASDGHGPHAMQEGCRIASIRQL